MASTSTRNGTFAVSHPQSQRTRRHISRATSGMSWARECKMGNGYASIRCPGSVELLRYRSAAPVRSFLLHVTKFSVSTRLTPGLLTFLANEYVGIIRQYSFAMSHSCLLVLPTLLPCLLVSFCHRLHLPPYVVLPARD